MVKWLIVATLPLLMAMGDQRRPGPVILPPEAAVPGAGLNREGTRGPLPEGGLPVPQSAPLRVLPASEATPAEFQWQSRVVVVFADTGADPSFVRQLNAFTTDAALLLARDVVVVTDTEPAAATTWRRMLRPEGFSLVLIDKDGQVKARKPSPWTVREIVRAIDKFPSRLQEVGRAGLGL